MTNEKYFPKTISQWEFVMTCLQTHQELLSLTTFLQVHSNSKEVSYLSWQNIYPNSKNTCHIKLKCFLRTKLLENLLLAKYLTSVTAPLMNSFSRIYLIWYLNWIGFTKPGVPLILIRQDLKILKSFQF